MSFGMILKQIETLCISISAIIIPGQYITLACSRHHSGMSVRRQLSLAGTLRGSRAITQPHYGMQALR